MAVPTTVFVDNLPFDVGQIWFKKFYGKFGFVIDSFIPFKRSRRNGQRFGFVRFLNKEAANLAIAKTNGFRIENRCIIAKIVRYAKGGELSHQNQSEPVLKPFGKSHQMQGSFGK